MQQIYTNLYPTIFSVNEDGVVYWSRILFDETGRVLESSRGFVGYSESQPSLLSASKDGKFVFVGCRDGSVYVWEPVGGSSGKYVLKARLLCSENEAEKGSVESAVLSESDHFLAACTSNGDLYF